MKMPSLASPLLALGISAMLMAACTQHAAITKKPVKKAAAKVQTHYTADEYLYHLALADIALQDKSQDASSVDSSLQVLQAYTAKSGKKAKTPGPAFQQVAVLECKLGAGMLREAAPLVKDERTRQALQNLLGRLRARGCVLTNVHTAKVVVKKDIPLTFAKATPDEIRDAVHAAVARVLATQTRPGALKEAQDQIKLLRLLIDSRQQDAAYIATENAKQTIALAENAKENRQEIETLLSQLEALETELHKAMPYSL